ncbi:HAUS augmin-like complex subunit 8 [Microtus ochrogaster]|uniref:HAUS augmin-like complex subunit 8 n=1 Tax=Microtus ochrogaster TaxID=79684 RepID=A0A8J6G2W3_MICOH|nr:HAUS augmin-like complex subunit 8 [Microtus ochrogaster]
MDSSLQRQRAAYAWQGWNTCGRLDSLWIFSLAMELSSQASKEAALMNQEVWEEAQGTPSCSQWYFGPEAADITNVHTPGGGV